MISWSTELIAVLKPQGDCFWSVSHKSRGSLILSLTDLRKPSTVIITNLKMGPILYTMVASLYSYFCCHRLDTVPAPLIKLPLFFSSFPPQSALKWPLAERNTGSSQNCRFWALARGFTHTGGLHQNGCTWARNWTLGGGALF